MKPEFLENDPQNNSPQRLEDLATAYWYSEALFTAVELDLFTLLDACGRTAGEVAAALGLDSRGMERFLKALCALGLLVQDGNVFCNTRLAGRYLVRGREHYQGNSILWRRYLSSGWRGLGDCLRAGGRVAYPDAEEPPEQRMKRVRSYIRAMDDVAGTKVQELLPLFEGVLAEGEILDVGAGSGGVAAGFLRHFPGLRATLVDLPEVLEVAGEMLREKECGDRVSYHPANLLEPWDLPRGRFDLVLLSNIVHAYSEEEVPGILSQAGECLSPGGFLLVHDFFPEHRPDKARLFDLNMLINTYNGRVFPAGQVREWLQAAGLAVTPLIPLASDTALLIAARDRGELNRLALDPVTRFEGELQGLGFNALRRIRPDQVEVAAWTVLRCRFGCPHYGKPHCPPNTPTPEQTRQVLAEFRTAFLLEGEPPARDFQLKVLEAERAAFRAGFYKAFAFWAGPCALCNRCVDSGNCRRPAAGRPSMEAAGIDVFATVRGCGFSLTTLKNRDDYVKYFALLLLE